MRVEGIARLLITLAHGLLNLCVTIGGTTDQTADTLVALAVEVVDTGEVRRVTHIHRIGEGLHGRFRLVLSCLQILIEDIVGIIGGYETLDGQSHGMTEQSGTDISEITRWHTHHEFFLNFYIITFSSFYIFLHAGIGIEIVECLWQETGDIDAVGRGESHVFVQFLVHKGVLHQ